MAPSTAPNTRLLGLGNELLADDAFGLLAARQIEARTAAVAVGQPRGH